ncbi:DUF4376 domain-containing protein [Rhizobium miluonense]|uniref:DUF4376 domain-containing protein n=1 Tax=Rhizobium miluonense TaxID=411945 RepID=A0A1C3WP30_9HYPH|nr:DUF4376 domain-containing protein [Rhizobium miluonense]SCB41729.1 protein of unknown function [Rhizobium miluonense]
MKSAIIEDGVVTNVIVGTIDGSIECGDDVGTGWTYSGGVFVAPLAPTPSKDDLLSYAAGVRFTKETGGYAYDGHLISTDRDSQSKIGNVALAATIKGQSFSTQWKCSDGAFVTLTQETAVAMATAVMTFISACFATEGAVAAEISSGAIQTFSQIDSASWPAASSPSLLVPSMGGGINT